MFGFTSPSASTGLQWPKDDIPSLDLASQSLNHEQGLRNVYKFGGTSVGSPERLYQLVSIVKAERSRVIAVVVSAMAKNTDLLLDAAALAAAGDIEKALELIDQVEEITIENANLTQVRILGDKHPSFSDMRQEIRAFHVPLRQLLLGMSLLREKTQAALDTILSFGERISATIVARLLTANGVPAVFVDARTWVTTDATFGSAAVDFDASKEKLLKLAATWGDKLPVITGFIGQSTCGRTTTLGRNGSDYTATIIGASLKADYVVINTDISGVMTADPRIVHTASPVRHLSHHEALELAIYGTRMFHTRTMLPLIKSGVTMLIRNTMDPNGGGTYISGVAGTDNSVTCTTSLENLSLIEVRTRILQEGDRSELGYTNIGARVVQCLENNRVSIWLSIRAAHGQSISIVVPSSQEALSLKAISEELKSELEKNEVDALNCTSPVTMLSIVGEKLHKASTNGAKMFTALANAGIDVLAVGQGTSSRSLSCIVQGAKTKLAVRRVHDAFNASTMIVSLVLLGCNKITLAIINKILEQADTYRQRHNIEFQIVGFSSKRSGFQFNTAGLVVEDIIDEIAQIKSSPPLTNSSPDHAAGRPSIDNLHSFRDLSCPIVIDCSGWSDNGDLYAQCLENEIHVVVSNVASANALSTATAVGIASRNRLETSNPCFFLYNAAIGAGLPILDTLANLLQTGDQLDRVDTALSGSMGFISDQVMRGHSLSSAVQQAWENGYLEANPIMDVSGADMQQKVKLFSRALGVQIELSDIDVTPFVPYSVLNQVAWDGVADVPQLINVLKQYDATFDANFVQPALTQGKRIRYVATIEPQGLTSIRAKIEPLLVDETHPTFATQKNEISVGFTTTEYNYRPLTITGSGTGGRETATGVVRDILTIVKNLQGHI
ncbi:bifunctional aspartokinase/homoserine dehydrogenase [Thraustotheca clavata]|uniref:Bifunctional aspartokinase/homoserine dehydrogenase n=1 Tax=Thraustotheca clavata TaxID=74557 RepID=A0A1V9ZBI3_9STRA|nr:bifunctional aspartokinase/homoserine dehydrogenase [Thraustotheca clavata]